MFLLIFYTQNEKSTHGKPKHQLTAGVDKIICFFFQFLNQFLSVGPPFYIVVNSTNLKFDYAELENRNKMCGSYQCNEDSLQNTVALWSKVANKTYVASPAFSWVDDYDAFMRNGRCCSYQAQWSKINNFVRKFSYFRVFLRLFLLTNSQ